jgi:threonine synthase
MRLFSTLRRTRVVGFREALLQGLAPDGGLFQPIELPRIEPSNLESWRGLPFDAVARQLAQRLLEGEFPPEVIERSVSDALNFPVPMRPLGEGLWVLELFHGPTMAFKDFGARFLARLFSEVLCEEGDHATVLVATSGDTGSAVARGFAGVAGTRVVVLYPAGKVSPFQEAQMATIGGNVTAVRVPGVFDDCQRLVKSAMLDPGLAPLRLSSANSINIGRLLPQTFYYVTAYLDAATRPGEPVVFSVPSGNLGNLTAGVMAARMGLPVSRFVAATNANDVLPDYLDSGIYRPRASVATLSNAMDVGDPSNFARLAAMFGSSAARMRKQIAGMRVSEAQTRAAIRDAYRRSGVMLDPHAAVAYCAALRFRQDAGARAPIVVLATAHPAKFGEVIREELGVEPELPASEREWRSRLLLSVDLPDVSAASLSELLCNLPAAPAA